MRPSRFKKVEQAREVLATLHPTLFGLENPVPLKIGISADIKSRYPELSWTLINYIMHRITIRRAYLAACTAGAARYGLDGPVGDVTEKHAKWAAEVLALREAHAKAREQAAA